MFYLFHVSGLFTVFFIHGFNCPLLQSVMPLLCPKLHCRPLAGNRCLLRKGMRYISKPRIYIYICIYLYIYIYIYSNVIGLLFASVASFIMLKAKIFEIRSTTHSFFLAFLVPISRYSRMKPLGLTHHCLKHFSRQILRSSLR